MMAKAIIALCSVLLLVGSPFGNSVQAGSDGARHASPLQEQSRDSDYSAQVRASEPLDLLIYNVWVRPTAPAPADGATPEAPIPGTVTGAYLTIENTGTRDYQLVGASSDLAAMTDIHQSTMDNGVMRMRQIDSLDIPAGETVTLAPSGYHVMLMDVTRDVYPGQAIPLTLTFADSNGATFRT